MQELRPRPVKARCGMSTSYYYECEHKGNTKLGRSIALCNKPGWCAAQMEATEGLENVTEELR